MKIKLIVVYKTDSDWVKEGLNIYLNRLKKYLKVELKEIEVASISKKSRPEVLIEEAVKILKATKPSDYIVLLDEKGTEHSSHSLAAWLNKKFISVQGDIVFIVGGPFGFHESVISRSSEKLSLSQLTFTHQMIRVFFVEQLYRAMTILKNEPYHHD